MQTDLNYIWKEVQVLSRSERMKLAERLINQMRVEDEGQEKLISWEDIYGIGKGVWEIDAQGYVNQLREERD